MRSGGWRESARKYLNSDDRVSVQVPEEFKARVGALDRLLADDEGNNRDNVGDCYFQVLSDVSTTWLEEGGGGHSQCEQNQSVMQRAGYTRRARHDADLRFRTK